MITAEELDIPLPMGNEIVQEFNRELNYISNELKTHFKDVIVTLEKEARGGDTVFALDFDVLHSFLYPSQRRKNTRVSPTLLNYVISNCPAKFIIPPGTIHELLEFLDDYREAVTKIGNLSTSSELSEIDKEELLSLYKKIIDDEVEISNAIQTSEKLLWGLRSTFASIAKSLSGLFGLIAQKRIVPLTDLCGDNPVEYDEDDVATIAARITAIRPNFQRSNRRDAMNLAAIIRAYQSQAQLDHLELLTDNLTGVTSFHLLSGTESLSRLNLDDFGSDTIGINTLRMLPEFFQSRSSSWYIFNAVSATIYTYLRSTTEGRNAALEKAHRIYHSISEVSFRTLAASRARPEQSAYDKLFIGQLLPEEFCEFYIPFRNVLSTGVREVIDVNEVFSACSKRIRSYTLTDDGSLSPEIIDREVLFQGLKSVSRDFGAEVARVFGISKRVENFGRFNRLHSIDFESKSHKTMLFRIQKWPDHGLFSCSWPTSFTIGEIITYFTEIAHFLRSRSGCVTATFDLELYSSPHSPVETDSEGRKSVKKKVGNLSCLKTLSILDFVRPSPDGSYILTPTAVSIESDVADIHFLPSGSNAANCKPSSVVVNFVGFEIFKLVELDLMFSSHLWSWCHPIISHFYSELNAVFNESTKQSDAISSQ